MTNFSHDRELPTRGRHALENARNRSSNQFLVDLGQFPGNYDLAVSNFLLQRLERSPDPMRRFEEYNRSTDSLQSIEPRISVFTPNRGEAMEREHICRRARNSNGRQHGRCAG